MSSKKVIVITGASKGIGKAIAEKLASKKFDVVIFGRNKKRLALLKSKLELLNSNTLSFSGDVADEKFVQRSITKVIKHYGRIDGVINNAGVAIFETFIDSNLEQLKTQIDANLIGVYNFCKASVPKMIEQKSGTIINIVSTAGKFGFAYGTTYAATKHAVIGFSKSLLLEVRKHNVKVVTVSPGSVETDMIVDSPIHKDVANYLQPKDVADVILTILKLPSRAMIGDIDIRPTNP
ncbi:MAG: SDR family oxidoreductase [Melioribacteraceae bacterium]